MKKILSVISAVLLTAAVCITVSANTSYDRLLLNDNKVNGKNVMGSYVEIEQGDRLYLLGWAVNKTTGSRLKEAVYTVNGKEYKCADNYRDRKDVADALGIDSELGVHAGIGHDDDACELLGINELPAGEYSIVIKAKYEDGTEEDLVGAKFTLKVNSGTEEQQYEFTNKELAEMKLIAYKNGASYAFCGLAKFDLAEPFEEGGEPDYTVFTKYYGFDIGELKENGVKRYDKDSGITVYGKAEKDLTDDVMQKYADRFALYEDVVYGSENRDYSEFAGTLPQKYSPAPYEDRLVGVAYSTWMYKTSRFTNCWEIPLLGKYTSLDSPETLEAHAALLYDADVDFVLVDWSNNVDYDFYNKKDYRGGRARNDFETIEMGTTQMFESWSKLENTPNIAIFIGCPNDESAIKDGRLQKKADQVYREYIENEEFAKKYQTYLGKPLLVVYLGTPALAQSGLKRLWNDDRFTVRFLTGYIGQQSMYNSKTRAAKEPIWSWEERGQQCYAVNGNTVECMTVQSAWRSQDSPGDPNYIEAGKRNDGDTFLKMWARAKAFGPQIVLCPTWNEYSKGEQPTPEINKDLEPTVESGTLYYDILKEQIKLFKTPPSEDITPDDTTETETEAVTEAGKTTAEEKTEAEITNDETTNGQEDKGNSFDPKPFLFTAAAVILAAAIAVGSFIFHRKKSEKRRKK